MSKTMTWRVLGTTMVCRHRDIAPADAEWNEFCAAFRDAPVDSILVWAPGGAAPSSAQRAKVIEVFKAKPNCKAAVLTNSRLTRGAAVAISWFVSSIRAFDEGDTAGAARFMGVDPSRTPEVVAGLQKLATELGE